MSTGQAPVTQTFPSPLAIAEGVPFTGIVATTVFVSGSILEIVLLRAFTTQIASSLAATAVGPSPTGIIFSTALVRGSIRSTESWVLSDSQTAPNPTAMPDGANGSGRTEIVAAGYIAGQAPRVASL